MLLIAPHIKRISYIMHAICYCTCILFSTCASVPDVVSKASSYVPSITHLYAAMKSPAMIGPPSAFTLTLATTMQFIVVRNISSWYMSTLHPRLKNLPVTITTYMKHRDFNSQCRNITMKYQDDNSLLNKDERRVYAIMQDRNHKHNRNLTEPGFQQTLTNFRTIAIPAKRNKLIREAIKALPVPPAYPQYPPSESFGHASWYTPYLNHAPFTSGNPWKLNLTETTYLLVSIPIIVGTIIRLPSYLIEREFYTNCIVRLCAQLSQNKHTLSAQLLPHAVTIIQNNKTVFLADMIKKSVAVISILLHTTYYRYRFYQYYRRPLVQQHSLQKCILSAALPTYVVQYIVYKTLNTCAPEYSPSSVLLPPAAATALAIWNAYHQYHTSLHPPVIGANAAAQPVTIDIAQHRKNHRMFSNAIHNITSSLFLWYTSGRFLYKHAPRAIRLGTRAIQEATSRIIHDL